MTDGPRTEARLDSRAAPEEVCRDHPKLLPEVRAWWRVHCVAAELDRDRPDTIPPNLTPSVPPAFPEASGPYAVTGCFRRGTVVACAYSHYITERHTAVLRWS